MAATGVGVRQDQAADGIPGSLRRFAVLFAILLVAIPVILWFVFATSIYHFWIEQFDGPELQKQFGFTLERREVVLPSGEHYPRPVVTEVTPGGRFAQLGVRPGDAIVCLYHGIADFYSQLMLARDGYEAHFRVISVDQYDVGCTGAREVHIPGRGLP